MTTMSEQKKPHRKARKLVIEEETYWWMLGVNVYVWFPNGSRGEFPAHEIAGVSHQAWEDQRDIPIRPGQVASAIKAFLSQDTEAARLAKAPCKQKKNRR